VIALAARMLVVLVMLVGAGASSERLDAAGKMSIRAWPATAFEPANLRVEVMIERRAENRWIRISADAQDYFSSSESQLEGERSSRIRVVTFREVPAGIYELRSEVFGDDGRVMATARTLAVVVGR
jgi:hypothetical protein